MLIRDMELLCNLKSDNTGRSTLHINNKRGINYQYNYYFIIDTEKDSTSITMFIDGVKAGENARLNCNIYNVFKDEAENTIKRVCNLMILDSYRVRRKENENHVKITNWMVEKNFDQWIKKALELQGGK